MTPPWQNTATAPESTRDKPLHRRGNPSAKLHHHRVVTGVSHQRPPLTKLEVGFAPPPRAVRTRHPKVQLSNVVVDVDRQSD